MVNIDTVYQRVLAIANKEQRGYITPQEYNLLANQAQLEIFDAYFYKVSGNHRTDPDTVPFAERNTTEGDIKQFLKEKLALHTSIATVTAGTIFPANYMVGRIFNNGLEAHRLDRNAIEKLNNSPRHLLNRAMPYYCESQTNGEDIEVYFNGVQQTGVSVTCEIITKPAAVEWDYVVVNEKALYNSGGNTVHFDLHESEENLLVYKICELAGIVINKPGLTQSIGQMTTNVLTEQKQ